MDNLKTSEADMGYVRDFVQKIAEALVSATELPKQIEAIQASMTTLSSDLERTKARNIELDTLLNDTRRQRDEAEQALSGVKAELATAQASVTRLADTSDSQDRVITDLRTQLDHVKKERDDYGLKQMEAEDRATKAEATLKEMRKALGMPEPEAKPTTPAFQPSTPAPTSSVPDPNPVQAEVKAEQAIPNSPKRIYEGDFGFTELSHFTEKYDPERSAYYRTA